MKRRMKTPRRTPKPPFELNDIRISRHANRRFRQRVKRVSTNCVPFAVRMMLKESQPVASPFARDGCYYFSHELAMFVFSADGTLKTVLPPDSYSIRPNVIENRTPPESFPPRRKSNSLRRRGPSQRRHNRSVVTQKLKNWKRNEH